MSSLHDAQGNRLPLAECPTCKRKLDAAAAREDGARPSPGDISVCLGCGEILEFKEDMHLTTISLNHMLELPPEISAEILQAQRRIRAMRPLENL